MSLLGAARLGAVLAVAIGYMCARLNALGWHFMFGVHLPHRSDWRCVSLDATEVPHHSPLRSC